MMVILLVYGLCVAAPGSVECLSVYQYSKANITHVTATTHKDATDIEAESNMLYYFVLPNDITYRQ